MKEDTLQQYPTALTIAGSDSGGGAGLQADIKTMQACQVFSTTVITCITAQNTYGVQDAIPLPTEMIDAQFNSLYTDFNIGAAKTGALFDEDRVRAVAKNVRQHNITNLIIDPVMVAKGGSKLLSDSAIEAFITELLPLALLVTPNIPEAEALSGRTILTQEDMKEAARHIQSLGAKNVLLKGGHLETEEVQDLLLLESGEMHWFTFPRVVTNRTHGTGDTLSAGITAAIAKGMSLLDAIAYGERYLHTILETEIIIGHGHGPLNHWGHDLER